MKKLFLAAAIALLSVGANAQQAPGTFTLRPEVGMTISNITKGDGNFKSKVGLVAGVEGQYQLTELLGVTAGALYSMEGCKIKNTDTKLNLDYINVPVLVNIYPIKGAGLAIKAGMQFGFNVRHKLSASNGSASASLNMDDINTFNFSFPVGLSYEYMDFILDARYNMGVSKIRGDYDNKSSVFTITLGYKFAL